MKTYRKVWKLFPSGLNYELVKEALITAGRADLIGFEKKCLIRPPQRYGNTKKTTEIKKNTAAVSKKTGGTAKKKTIRNVHKKK